jgi:hypothetical protein
MSHFGLQVVGSFLLPADAKLKIDRCCAELKQPQIPSSKLFKISAATKTRRQQNNAHDNESQLPQEQTSTLVNTNQCFKPVSATELKKKIGMVCVLAEVRRASRCPGDHCVCPWCGRRARNAQATKKHSKHCDAFIADHSPQENGPFLLPQQNVIPSNRMGCICGPVI